MNRKTIYQYDRIKFQENEVTNGTVIILTALPTCIQRKNCTSCIKKDTNFQVYYFMINYILKLHKIIEIFVVC